MKVVIAEKPSVAREIAAVLGASTKKEGYLEGNGYQVTWAFGHLVGLVDAKVYGWTTWSKENLPMIPARFQIAPLQRDGVSNQLSIIGKLFKSAERIIVATDAGREGELIFRYIYAYLQDTKGVRTPFDRLWISSLTDKAIKEGFDQLKPGSDYDHVYEAAKARSEADWLVGINATIATTLNINSRSGVWSIGRVQTPTLAMICKRFIANRDFVPTPYYVLQVTAEQDSSRFSAQNAKRYDKRDEAQAMLDQVRQSDSLLVKKIEKKEERQAPPLLYDLTSLQKEANSRYGYTADKTLNVAQSLYEKKLTTYPRTGSRYIPDDVYDLLPGLIRNVEAMPDDIVELKCLKAAAERLRGKKLGKISVNAAKVTDHHALLPTEKVATRADIEGLSREELYIYRMIVGRMLETVSDPCLKFVTTVTLISPTAEDVPFVAKGFVVKREGWRGVLGIKEEKKEDEFAGKLPDMNENDHVRLKDGFVLSKQTKAPALLTENTLLGMMEVAGRDLDDEEQRESMKDVGIGTPATRAAIIETLLKREYIVREKKSLLPTEKGLALYDVVKDMRISNVEVTGNWEAKLNRICEGKLEVELFNKEIVDYTREVTDELSNCKIDTSAIREAGATNCICPKCKEQNLKFSQKGFLYCTDKECDFIIPLTIYGKKIDGRTALELAARGRTKLIRGFKSKAGKAFDAPLVLKPDFKIGFDLPDRGVTEDYQATCPKCKHEGLKANKSKVWCELCQFTLWRAVSGRELSNEEIKALIEKGRTEVLDGFVSKQKKAFSAALVVDKDFKVVFEFPERQAVPYEGVCPKCGESMLRLDGRSISCGHEGCGFSLWLDVCGHRLTDDEIKTLLESGKTGLLTGLKGKDKKVFDACLVLDKEFKVVFAFPEREKKPYEGVCPKCGESMLRLDGRTISCAHEGCGFSLWLDVSGHRLTDDEIKALLESGKTGLIKGFINKEMKKFDASLVLSKEYKVLFDQAFEGLCPKCNRPSLTRSLKAISCSADGCGFSMWTENRGHTLTDGEITQLLTSRKTGLISFKSKEGKAYKAYLSLNDQFAVTMNFDNSAGIHGKK